MALPFNYTDKLDYFTRSVEFLKEFAWIYQHSNTTFLKSGVLENFPIEFKKFFLSVSNEELNNFPLLDFEERIDTEFEKLQSFRTRLKNLIPTEAYKQPSDRSSSLNSKMNFRKINLKKQHEICQLAEVINTMCHDCHLLLDFGAGHGYLSEMLYTLSNNRFLILGLESEIERIYAAETRRQEFLPEASNRIIYKQQFITEASLPVITAASGELCNSHNMQQPKIAIVGLHACADLTITAMKLFFEMGPTLTRLIIMPCCYHKMEMTPTGIFRNFPLSHALTDVLANDPNFLSYLNRPFLRLACQQTLARWQNASLEKHKLHGIEMFRRSLAEAIIDESTEYVAKRRGVSQQCKTECLDDSFVALSQIYELKSKVTNETLLWSTQHEKKFKVFSTKYPEGHKLAEGLTCLQTAMQKLCENIVLYDRLCFMQEYASARNLKLNVRYEKLLDEKLSPRCYALIAEKL